MTYLLHPAAMKLFFSAQDDQIAFRQAPWQVSLLLPCSDTLPVLLKTELMRQQSSKRDVLCSGRPATEHFTNRVFGLPSHLFFPHHTALLHGLRAQLTPAQLPHHAHGLLLGLETHAQALLSSSNKVPLLASTGMATDTCGVWLPLSDGITLLWDMAHAVLLGWQAVLPGVCAGHLLDHAVTCCTVLLP